MLIVAVIILAGGIGTWAYVRAQAEQPAVGRTAPDFTLHDLDGNAVRLADLRGQAVFVNFWATWCTPCREETPALVDVYRRYGDQFVLLSINVGEPARNIRAFMDEFSISYPVLRDADKRIANRYLLRGYPESWFISPQGVITSYAPGQLDLAGMKRRLEQTLGRPLTDRTAHP